MPFFSGFAGEFGRQLQTSRQEEADRAEKSNALEASVLQHLSTSPDPEIAAHGITGLLDLADPSKANKRAGGLAGFLGKQAQHPALPTIRQLVTAGRQVEVPEHVPGLTPQEGVPSGAGTPVGLPGMATPPAAAATPPPPATTPGDVYQPPRTVTVPRTVFDTPEAVAGKTAQAQRTGVLNADIGAMRGSPSQPGLTPEEQGTIFGHVPATIPAGTVQGKSLPAGATDNSGRPVTPEGYYQGRANPRNPSQTMYFPVSAPASIQNQAAIAARPTFQHYVGPDGKTPGVWRVYRDGSKAPEFVGYAAQKGQYLQYVDPDTQEVSYIAAPAVYTQGATLPSSSQPPAATAPPAAGGPGVPAPAGAPAGAAPGAPGGAPGGAAGLTPVAQAALAAARQTPPLAPRGGAAGAGAAGATGTPTTPASTAPPARGISGGRKRTLEPVKGAYLGPDGQPQVGQAFVDKGTGKYYSAQDASQPATGFIPGDEGAYAATAYAQANNTLITVHAALKALEDAGVATDNDTAHTADLMYKFYSGTTGGNPIEAAVSSLTNLAGLQGATQYIRSNSRSYQMFQQALQHLPVTPTQRVAALSQTPVVGGMVTPGVAMVAGSHGWDSFASMYAKLKQAETIIQQGKGSLAELTGKTADRAIGAGSGQAGPPAPTGAAGAAHPAIGQRGVVNGQAAVWDGHGWVAAPAGRGGGG